MKMSFDANLKDGSAREANLHLDAGMSAEYYSGQRTLVK